MFNRANWSPIVTAALMN